jgi:TPR repeat protein
MSADQGHAFGQYDYGLCLQNGRGVATNLPEAARYFKMSADHGDADALEEYRRCLDSLSPLPATETSVADAVIYIDLTGFEKVRELGRGGFGGFGSWNTGKRRKFS